jgi:hypothetical protein
MKTPQAVKRSSKSGPTDMRLLSASRSAGVKRARNNQCSIRL